jgi:uncharacterized protein (TIGR02270 family)
MTPELFEEHLGEAAFLWRQREHALVSPRHTPADTATLEARLLRHVDGMVLAGVSASERRLVPLLEEGEPDEASVATLVLLDAEVQQWEPVLSALRRGEDTRRTAICQALRARPREALVAPLCRMLEDGPPALQALLLDVLAHWRSLPLPLVEQLLARGEPLTQAAALRTSPHLPKPLPATLILSALSSKEVDVQAAALCAGLMGAVDGVWEACRQQATSPGQASATARLLLALGGEPSERVMLTGALARPEPLELRQQTLWALGFSGCAEAAAACLPWMSSQEPLTARLAGEAFCAITGLRLEGELVRPDEDEEPNAAPSSLTESWLPLPGAQAVSDWWQRNRSRFSARERYLDGVPCSPERLLLSFDEGPMRRREVHALELTLRTRGAWSPPLRAFMTVQKQDVEPARALAARTKATPFAVLARMAFSPSTSSARPRGVSRQLAAPPGPESPVVTAMGMVSPLALGVAASCAAASAGLLKAAELEGCEALDPVDGQHHPVRGHPIPQLTQGFVGLGRLARLGEAALGELRNQVEPPHGVRRLGLYVALSGGAHLRAHERLLAAEEADDEEERIEPEPRAAQVGERLLPLLVRLTGLPIPHEHQRSFPADAVGFLHALEAARLALRQGRLDCCIVGGVDSLVEPERLRALKAIGLLKVPGQPSRMLPGEAAAFLVLERDRDARHRGAIVLASCEGIRAPAEPPETWDGPARAGRALAESLAGTLASLPDGGRHTGRIIGCLNGHDRRAYAWGHALPRLETHTGLSQLPMWSPAEAFGELGAATGPVAVCMAVRDFARGVTASPAALVWLMGDEGEAGSFHVRAMLRERLPTGERA